MGCNSAGSEEGPSSRYMMQFDSEYLLRDRLYGWGNGSCQGCILCLKPDWDFLLTFGKLREEKIGSGRVG